MTAKNRSEPLFSIIIPYYNRPELLVNCIAKLTSQNFANWEAIIVDDASTQPLTAMMLKAFDDRVRIIRNNVNRGAGGARNEGLKSARGDYILFLDCDDELDADALLSFADLTNYNNPAVLVGAWSDIFASGARRDIRLDRPYGDDLANCVSCGWVTGSFVIKRELCPSVSETRMPWEMAEVILAALAVADCKVEYLDRIVAIIRQDSEFSLTIAHDHFDPIKTISFWSEMRERYGSNEQRMSAFDKRILDQILNLYWQNRKQEAIRLSAFLSKRDLVRYTWVRFLSPAWFAAIFGASVGLAMHSKLNAVKRALS